MQKNIRELFDSSYQGVKKLFDLAYDNTAGKSQVSDDSFKKYFLPRVKIENYKSKLMEEIFMIIQLMTPWSITMNSEKYWQGKAMITRLVVC